MPPHPAALTTRRRRRQLRMLGVTAAAAAGWMASGLPFAAAAPTAAAGDMDTEIITLTGATGEPTAAASGEEAADAAALRNAPDAAAAGWSARVDVDDGTQAVALSWTDAPTGEVEVRGHGDDGWSGWIHLHADPDERPDGAERDSGGMAWFGDPGVDEVEVRVESGALVDLELQSMRYEAPEGAAVPAAAATTSAAAQPTILPRSSYTNQGWVYGNSGCGSGPKQAADGIAFAAVHHTVNSNTYSASDVPAMLAAIYAYHTGTNGWCDTGYNFLVDRFGRIWEGRSGGIDKAIVGGHASGFNTGSVGVAFLGQYEPGVSPSAIEPTAASVDAASALIGWKLGLHGVDPTSSVRVTSGGSNKWSAGTQVTLSRVSGHRDLGYTACPGLNLYEQLPAIRLKAKAAQDGPTTTTTTTTPPPPPQFAPFGSASELVTQQYRDVLKRAPSASDLSYWTARVGSSWTPGKFVAHLTDSTEADNRVHAVTRLYRAYFLRNPDHGGFTYWMNRRGEGRTIASISHSFASSSEFRNRYGDLSNSAFVDRVYRNVLDRPADSGGLAYWTGRLAAGVPRGQVMASFSQSSEYTAQTRSGSYVVSLFESMLLKAPPADVYVLFEAALSNGSTTLGAEATYVFESAEYAARFG